MAVKIQCDSCEKFLRNEVDATGAEPDAHYTLKVVGVKGDKTIHPLDMDLCPKCARKYLRHLQEPIA
jgi:hypothetical protein